MRLRSVLTRVGAPVRWGLRAHWVTATLLSGACAGALMAVLAVSAMITRATGIGPRFAPAAVRVPDLELPTSALVTTPADVRLSATTQLFQLLLLVTGGVFLVAVVSVLAIAAARAAARSHEIVVRRAVGASRRLLLAAALVETVVLAGAALALGGAIGGWGSRLALHAWPGLVGPGDRWMAILVVLATVALLGVGVMGPATTTRRRMPVGGRKGRALELVLPALQLGVSLTVLCAAALLERHARRVEGVGAHGTHDGRFFEIGDPDKRPAARAGAYAELLRHLGGQGTTVSLTSPGTLVGLGTGDGVLTDCGQCALGGIFVPFRFPYVTHYLVSADTFRTLGLRVVAGRGINDADGWEAPRVAVVGQALAEHDFQNGQAVGRRVQIGHGPATWYTVVGIVADQLPSGYGAGLQSPYAIYLSVLQHPARSVDLLIQGPRDHAHATDVDRTLRTTLGDGITVAGETEAQRVAREAAPIRWFAWMFGAEGWMMLAIATLGTFVVMWLWVISQTHDLAVRRAVGARRRDVLLYVLARAAGVAVGGIALGLWCGASVWGALTSIVAGLPLWQSDMVVRYSLLLGGAALAGALWPAWRTARAAPAALIGHAGG